MKSCAALRKGSGGAPSAVVEVDDIGGRRRRQGRREAVSATRDDSAFGPEQVGARSRPPGRAGSTGGLRRRQDEPHAEHAGREGARAPAGEPQRLHALVVRHGLENGCREPPSNEGEPSFLSDRGMQEIAVQAPGHFELPEILHALEAPCAAAVREPPSRQFTRQRCTCRSDLRRMSPASTAAQYSSGGVLKAGSSPRETHQLLGATSATTARHPPRGGCHPR